MPQFEITKIQTLLGMSLAKADAELSMHGFRKLYNNISETIKSDQINISDRYINERIHQQLKKAVAEHSSKISLKHEYLNEMTKYLGFDDFFDFEKKYDNVKENPISISNQSEQLSISVIHDKSDTKFIKSKCEQALYKDQSNPYHYIPLHLKELKKDELIGHLDNSSVSIIFIDPQLQSLNQDLLNFIGEDSNEQGNIISIWLDCDKPEEFEKIASSFSWLTFDDFELLIQFLLAFDPTISSQNPTSKTPKPSTITNIHDSGTVNLGKIGKIKAEYISSRDMHININKSKSDD